MDAVPVFRHRVQDYFRQVLTLGNIIFYETARRATPTLCIPWFARTGSCLGNID